MLSLVSYNYGNVRAGASAHISGVVAMRRTGDDARWHDLSGSRVVRGAFWVSSAGVQPLAHALQRASNARRDVDIIFMIETHVNGVEDCMPYSSRSDPLCA